MRSIPNSIPQRPTNHIPVNIMKMCKEKNFSESFKIEIEMPFPHTNTFSHFLRRKCLIVGFIIITIIVADATRTDIESHIYKSTNARRSKG